MRTIKRIANQSMADVVVQGCGSLEGGMVFCRDNGVGLSDVPVTGMAYIISDEAIAAAGAAGAAVVKYLRQNDITVGNLSFNDPPTPVALGMRVVLYPVMVGARDAGAVSIPSVLGYWGIYMTGTLAFITTEGFAPLIGYLSDPNPVSYINESVLLAGGVPLTKNSEAAYMDQYATIANAPFWHVPYDAASTGTGVVFVQSGVFAGGVKNTLEFGDVGGNVAIVSPFIVLKKGAQGVLDSLLPTINVELVGSGGGVATVRVTRSHVGITSTTYANVALAFVDEAAAGLPDPADPGNGDKCIVELTAGPHTIGVLAQYMHSDGVHVCGYSMVEMVIEIA